MLEQTPSGTTERSTQTKMAEEEEEEEEALAKASKEAGKKPASKPGWAKGLRQLYDSVVDEPLPDDFQDLLEKLDTESS